MKIKKNIEMRITTNRKQDIEEKKNISYISKVCK